MQFSEVPGYCLPKDSQFILVVLTIHKCSHLIRVYTVFILQLKESSYIIYISVNKLILRFLLLLP